MKKMNVLFLIVPLAAVVALSTGCPPAEGEGEGEGDEGEGEGEGDAPCTDDSDCLEGRAAGADEGLCATTCVDPNDVTGDCAGGAAGPAFANGPVITDVSDLGGTTVGDPCDTGYSTFIATVYAEVAFDTSLNSQRLKFIDDQGAEGLTYSQADLLPDVAEVGDGYYTLTYYLCGTGDGGAVYLSDNDGNDGNAFCQP